MPLFVDSLQIGSLPHEGRAMQMAKSGKEMSVVFSKEVQVRFVLADSQIRADNFHRQDLVIGELGHGASLLQALLLGQYAYPLVNPTGNM